MDINQALRTALVFERKVEKMYAGAAARTLDPRGRRFLTTLAKEERSHASYLEARAKEFARDGRLTVPALKTAVPSPAHIKTGVSSFKKAMTRRGPAPGRAEADLLGRIVRAEEEVTAFYRGLVAEAGGDARAMFRRFLEIEEGHTALAQAELDAVTGLGFWFDVQEFSLEAA